MTSYIIKQNPNYFETINKSQSLCFTVGKPVSFDPFNNIRTEDNYEDLKKMIENIQENVYWFDKTMLNSDFSSTRVMVLDRKDVKEIFIGMGIYEKGIFSHQEDKIMVCIRPSKNSRYHYDVGFVNAYDSQLHEYLLNSIKNNDYSNYFLPTAFG